MTRKGNISPEWKNPDQIYSFLLNRFHDSRKNQKKIGLKNWSEKFCCVDGNFLDRMKNKNVSSKIGKMEGRNCVSKQNIDCKKQLKIERNFLSFNC